MAALPVYCILLLLTARHSLGEQKWSKPLADDRTSFSQDWVPVASSCPTCGRGILEAQATNGLVLTPPILSPPPLPVYHQPAAGSYIAQTLGQQQREIQQHFQQKQSPQEPQNVFLQAPSAPQSPPAAESHATLEASTSAPEAEEVQLVYVPVEALRRQKQNSAAIPGNLQIQAAHQAELLRNQQQLSRELQSLKNQQEPIPLQQQQVPVLRQEIQQLQQQPQPQRTQKYLQQPRQEYQQIQRQQQPQLRQQQAQEPHIRQPQVTPTRQQFQPEVTQIREDTQVQLTQTRPEFQQVQPQLRQQFQQSQPQLTPQTRPEFQQAQPQLTQTRQEFQQIQPQLTQTRPEFQQTQQQLTQTRPELQQIQPQLTQTRPEFQQAQPQLTQARPEFQQAQPQLTQTRATIQTNQEFQQQPATQSPAHQRRRRPPPPPSSPTIASTQRTSTPSTTPTPYQPPLSVYMAPNAVGHSGVKLADVIKVLRSSKSIAVLDRVSPGAPDVFVGPSELDPPQGYAKFELPYLSSLGNRVERAPRPPFFVAPLSFKPPAGYSKIPFPAPHVGSVVVSANATTNSLEGQQQFNLPAQLPPITAELPSLVNSLQSATSKPSPGDVHAISHQSFSSTTQAPKRRPPPAYEEEEEVAKLLQTLQQSGVTPATTDSFQYNLASRTRQQALPSTEKIPADNLQYSFPSRGRQQNFLQTEKTPNQYTPAPTFFPTSEPKDPLRAAPETQVTTSGFPRHVSSQTAGQFSQQSSRTQPQISVQGSEIQFRDNSALQQFPEGESQYQIQQDEITTQSAFQDQAQFSVQEDVSQRVQTPQRIPSPSFDNAPRYQVPQTERPSRYNVQDVRDKPQRQPSRYREQKQKTEILENNPYQPEPIAVTTQPSPPSSVIQDEVYPVIDESQFPKQNEAQDIAAPAVRQSPPTRQRTQQQYQRTQESQFTAPEVPQYTPTRQRGGSRRQQQAPKAPEQQQEFQELATENPSDSNRNQFLIQTVGPTEESLNVPVNQPSNSFSSGQGQFVVQTPETPLQQVTASPQPVVTQRPQQLLAQDIVIQTQTQRSQFQNLDAATPQYPEYKISIPDQTEPPIQGTPALRIPDIAQQNPLEYPAEDPIVPQNVQNTNPFLQQVPVGGQATAGPDQQAIDYYEQAPQETTTASTTTTTTTTASSGFRSRGRSRHRYTSAATDLTTSSPRSRPSYASRSRSRTPQYRTPRPSTSAEVQQESVAVSSFDQVGPFESSRRPTHNTPRSIGTEQENGQRFENSLRTRTRGRSRSRVGYTAATTASTTTTTTTTTTPPPPPEPAVPQFTIFAEPPQPQYQPEVQQQNINAAYSGDLYIQQEQLPASTEIPLAIVNVATTEAYPLNIDVAAPLVQQDTEYATEVPVQGKYEPLPPIRPVAQAPITTTERNHEDPSFVRIRGRVRQRQRVRQQQPQVYSPSPEQQYPVQSEQVPVLRNPHFPIDVLPDDIQTTAPAVVVTSPQLQQEIYTTTEKPVETTTARLRHNTNFLVRGSSRRPIRPTAAAPHTQENTPASTTAHPDKVYTVRPVRRPSPAPQNKVTIKGRVRRPIRPTTSTTPSTTSSSLPYVPPSAAANEVSLDEDGPSRPWGFFSDSIALKPTTPPPTTTEVAPTTRRFQVALLDSTPQDYQDYERQRPLPQQGQYQVVRRRKPARQRQQQYISQQQYEDVPQEFVSEYQNGNGFLLNLQHDQASLPSDNSPTQVMQSPETGEESRWTLPARGNVIPTVTEKYTETETPWSEEQVTTELPAESPTTSTIAAHVTTQNAYNETSPRTRGSGGRRRGAWVRVRVRPQQSSTDLLEAAESQNVATVAAANLIPGSDVIHKLSSTAAWASETTISTTPKGVEDEVEAANDTADVEKSNSKWPSSSDWWGEAGVHPNHRPYYSDNSAAAEISVEGQPPSSEASIWDMERYQQKSNFTNDSASVLNSEKDKSLEKEEDDYPESSQTLPQDYSGYKVWEDFSEDDVYIKHNHKEREEKKKRKKIVEVATKTTTSPTTSTEAEVTTANPLFPAEMTTIASDETASTTEKALELTPPVETNASSIRHADMHSLMKKILGTSTSTKVSHETEICYRGRCVKTKSKDLSHEEPSQDQVSTD